MNQDDANLFSKEEMQTLRLFFLDQAWLILESVDKSLVALEENSDDKEALEQIHRSLHTLKGDLYSIGFSEIGHLAHRLEDLLKFFQSGSDKIKRAALEMLIFGMDSMGKMLHKKQHSLDEEVENQAYLEKIELFLNGNSSEKFFNQEHYIPSKNKQALQTTDKLRIPISKVDALFKIVDELIVNRAILNQICKGILQEYPNSQQIARLQEVELQLGQKLGQLQEATLKVRMMQLSQLFAAFSRIVRDLARRSGKQVSLEIVGEETELDKRIADAIYEPLIHLLNNAVDHGIEPCDQRIQAGKPACGRICLRASQQSEQVVIELEDDGCGIDLDVLKKKALSHGYISFTEYSEMADIDALSLVFLRGLSTADRLTEISGRGIGMDVVKDVVERLSGKIEVSSLLGQGTRFTIHLPITLASLKSLLFKVNENLFALPVKNIREIINTKTFHFEDGAKQVTLHNQTYRLIDLRDLVYTESDKDQPKNRFLLVLGTGGEENSAILVDELLGECKVVVRTVEQDLRSVVSTVSVLTDGQIVRLLNIDLLLQNREQQARIVTN
ncbi:MAG: chemotaxis protein CheW [Blastocatellia bacterium]|nr:chemotaxis protein CheW [Blastocatellia bacterium]